jgi:hypothetical protein
VPCAYQCAFFATRLESQFVITGRVAHPKRYLDLSRAPVGLSPLRTLLLTKHCPAGWQKGCRRGLSVHKFPFVEVAPRKRWSCRFFNLGRTTETESLRIVETRILAVGGMSRLATAKWPDGIDFPSRLWTNNSTNHASCSITSFKKRDAMLKEGHCFRENTPGGLRRGPPAFQGGFRKRPVHLPSWPWSRPGWVFPWCGRWRWKKGMAAVSCHSQMKVPTGGLESFS